MTESVEPASARAGDGPGVTAVYPLGSSAGESARLQRQADELAPDSAALLDQVGLRPGQSAIDLGGVSAARGAGDGSPGRAPTSLAAQTQRQPSRTDDRRYPPSARGATRPDPGTAPSRPRWPGRAAQAFRTLLPGPVLAMG